MRKFVLPLMCSIALMLTLITDVTAQSFNGYQTIGRNTVSFSLIWSGKPYIGFSYAWRDFGTSFADIQAEVRMPIDNGFSRDEFQLISGFYRPSRLKRTFIGTGVHVVWDHNTKSGSANSLSGLVTAIPSYVYAASLNDGLYGTTGVRLSYKPLLWSENWDPTKQARHTIQAGIHFDSHHERTLGLSFNPTYNIHLDSEEEDNVEADVYVGQAYFLGRF